MSIQEFIFASVPASEGQIYSLPFIATSYISNLGLGLLRDVLSLLLRRHLGRVIQAYRIADIRGSVLETFNIGRISTNFLHPKHHRYVPNKCLSRRYRLCMTCHFSHDMGFTSTWHILRRNCPCRRSLRI